MEKKKMNEIEKFISSIYLQSESDRPILRRKLRALIREAYDLGTVDNDAEMFEARFGCKP